MKKSEHKSLNRLFSQLENGRTPNFFDMMSALSDISTIYPDSDSTSPVNGESKKPTCRVDIYPLNSPELFCQNCG